MDLCMQNELLVVPFMRAGLSPDGKIVLTRKFIEGMALYRRYWPGEVTVLLRLSPVIDDSLDHVVVNPAELPFGIEFWPVVRALLIARFAKAKVVLATLVREFLHLPKDCQVADTRLVWIAETSLRTRLQIIEAEVANPLRRYKRKLTESLLERYYRTAVARSNGVQCNGTPVFQAYKILTRRPFLFFDSRVGSCLLADADAIHVKTRRLLGGEPLRLAFSGRLISIKGVEFLPGVANELRRLGVLFTLDIYGAGDRESALQEKIARMGLLDCVRMRGVFDFESELVPVMKRDVDLFICCHPQGDPSCTYLETLSCGTPIAGFGNEAWVGLAALSGAGWVTPIGDPVALATQISILDKKRSLLVDACNMARKFSSRHTFEETMRARVDHLQFCVGDGGAA